MRRILVSALALALVSPAFAQETAFSRDVAAAIDRGLGWLDRSGAFDNPSQAGEGAGLAALALLEKRQSADLRAAPIGYGNATPEDRQRLDRVMDFIINRSRGNGFYAYRDGADLMALSVYLRTGGPRVDDARASLAAVFDRIAANQGAHGYWCYNDGSCRDSSTTQLAMAGLAAARGVFNDPAFADAARLARLDELTARARAAYANGGNADGVDPAERGHGYNQGNASSYQQTAAGLWCQIIGGATLDDGGVQAYLRWLRARYNYQSTAAANGGWNLSYFYYLWASAKAYTFIEDSGVAPQPGQLTTTDLGTLPPGDAPGFGARQMRRDPAQDPRVPLFGGEGAGYYASIHEPARWYYDYAYTLMSLLDGNGRFQPPGGHGIWDQYASQSYSLLVLERSVGGGCADTDDDRICDVDDNCPAVVNPEQADRDGDTVGDLCDNCPDAANADQADADGRDDGGGAGDACECVPVEETCNGQDDDCDRVADEGDPEGGAGCDTGVPGVCSAGLTACRDGALACDPLGAPSEEACNGLDDDCDGAADDGEPGAGEACETGEAGPCAAGLTACRDGGLRCEALRVPVDEVCNGEDDDCDGAADDGDPGAGARCETGAGGLCGPGVTACRAGALACDALQSAGDEVCDGLDNDCDGATDEGLAGGGCETGLPGVCAHGHQVCGAAGVECLPEAQARPEVCDGLDNDCDGAADEEAPGEGDLCGTGALGVCRAGRRLCAGGLMACPEINDPGEERCNREDDDCDGHVDEGVRNACGGCGPTPAEVCNGVDDDCDDAVDDEAPCPDGTACRFGRCLEPCAANECAGGRVCVEGLCATPCEAAQCGDGMACRDGECVDACQGVRCEAGRVCHGGACVADDCYGLGCADGQRCVDGACVEDPCADLFCDEGEFCREGVCVRTCADVSCPWDQSCRDGECVADACAEIACREGEACVDGACVGDPCDGVRCDDGRRCEGGACVHDACHGVRCPARERCEVVAGEAQCAAAWSPEPAEPEGADAGPGAEEDAAPLPDPFAPEDAGPVAPDVDAGVAEADPVTSGCACDTGGGPVALPWLLALLPLRRRRR